MSAATKDKILKVSQKLFFEYGIANIRLQKIADDAGISVGHLAYHYKNKEAIVSAVYQHVFKAMSVMLKSDVKPVNLMDFEELFDAIYRLVNTYPFCFNNIWEISRHHPEIQKKWKNFLDKKILRIEKRIQFHLKRGVLLPEPYEDAYKLLAKQLMLNFHFWIPQQILNGKPASVKLFKNSLWNLIHPYLTKTGIKEYKRLEIPNKFSR